MSSALCASSASILTLGWRCRRRRRAGAAARRARRAAPTSSGGGVGNPGAGGGTRSEPAGVARCGEALRRGGLRALHLDVDAGERALQRLRHLRRLAVLQVIDVDALLVHVARLVEPRDPRARLVEIARLARQHHHRVEPLDRQEADDVGVGVLARGVEDVLQLDRRRSRRRRSAAATARPTCRSAASTSKMRTVSSARRSSSRVPRTRAGGARSSGIMACPGGRIFASTLHDVGDRDEAHREDLDALADRAAGRAIGTAARGLPSAGRAITRTMPSDCTSAKPRLSSTASSTGRTSSRRSGRLTLNVTGPVDIGIDHVVELQGLAQHRGDHVANVGAGEIERHVGRTAAARRRRGCAGSRAAAQRRRGTTIGLGRSRQPRRSAAAARARGSPRCWLSARRGQESARRRVRRRRRRPLGRRAGRTAQRARRPTARRPRRKRRAGRESAKESDDRRSPPGLLDTSIFLCLRCTRGGKDVNRRWCAQIVLSRSRRSSSARRAL